MSKKKINIDQIKKEQTFSVPDGYFEELQQKIETRIALEAGVDKAIQITDAIPSKQPFEVPNNYFESLESKINAKISNLDSEETIELNPAIFSKEIPFQVPNNYFNALPLSVQDKVENTTTKWVFHFNWSPQVKLALIPAMMLAFVFGYIFFFNSNEQIKTDELIAQVSSEDLIAYLESSDLSTEDILDNIDLNSISNEFELDDTYQLEDLELDNESLDEFIDDIDFTIDA